MKYATLWPSDHIIKLVSYQIITVRLHWERVWLAVILTLILLDAQSKNVSKYRFAKQKNMSAKEMYRHNHKIALVLLPTWERSHCRKGSESKLNLLNLSYLFIINIMATNEIFIALACFLIGFTDVLKGVEWVHGLFLLPYVLGKM